MPENVSLSNSNVRPDSSNSTLRGRNLRAAQLRWDRQNAGTANPDSLDPRGRDQIPSLPESTLPSRAGPDDGLRGNANQSLSPTAGPDDGLRGSTASTPPADPSTAGQAPAAGSSTPSTEQASQRNNFRAYVPINPLEDRYDFLTGRKVFNAIGDGPVGTGGGSGPRQAGGTVNIRGTGETGSSTATGTPSVSQIDNPNVAPPQNDPGAPTEFTNAFGDTYTQADIDSVEQLRSFNEDIGGGRAQAQLTDGERAYAIEQGYLTGSTTTTSNPDAGDPRDF